MPELGGPVQVESALQEPLNFHDAFFMADSQAPVVLSYGRDTIVNEAGTLAATVTHDGVKIGAAGNPVELADRTPVAKFANLDPSSKFKRAPTAVGFLSDSSVIFTDGQRIFRADVQSGQAVLTRLLESNVKDKDVFNVTISSDKRSLAFLYREGAKTTLFTLPVDGGKPYEITTFDEPGVKILQFNN